MRITLYSTQPYDRRFFDTANAHGTTCSRTSRKDAVRPVIAALGGMIVPAVIHAAFNAASTLHPAGHSDGHGSRLRLACWFFSPGACRKT